MELSAVNTSDCIFKILPIYKVHSVGDEVRFDYEPPEGAEYIQTIDTDKYFCDNINSVV